MESRHGPEGPERKPQVRGTDKWSDLELGGLVRTEKDRLRRAWQSVAGPRQQKCGLATHGYLLTDRATIGDPRRLKANTGYKTLSWGDL